MPKRPVKFECPPGGVEDPIGSCRDFNPSYDTARVRVPAIPRDADRLLAAVSKITGLSKKDIPLDAPLKNLLRGRGKLDDLKTLLRVVGRKVDKSTNLDDILETATLLDLLPAPTQADLYAAQVRHCATLLDDEEQFRAAGCKRRGHVQVPAGRWSLARRGKAPPENGISDETKTRLGEDLPPLDARTQSPRIHARWKTKKEKLEAEEEATLAALRKYAKTEAQRAARLPRSKKAKSNPDDASARRVKKREKDLKRLQDLRALASPTSGTTDPERALAQRRADELAKRLAQTTAPEDISDPARRQQYEHVAAARAAAERAAEEEERVIRLQRQAAARETERIRAERDARERVEEEARQEEARQLESERRETLRREAQAPTQFVVPDRVEPLIRAGVSPAIAAKMVEHLRGATLRLEPKKTKASFTQMLSRLFANAIFVPAPPDRGPTGATAYPYFSVAELDLKRVKKPAHAALPLLTRAKSTSGRMGKPIYVQRVVATGGGRESTAPIDRNAWPDDTNVWASGLDPHCSLVITLSSPMLNETINIKVQHSELARVAAGNTAPNYTTLRGFSAQELSGVLSRKTLSPRKRRRGRSSEPFLPPVRTNPLATYTLTPADLTGPALRLDGTPVAEMRPGTYKPYGPGKAIFWGTKSGATPKVVSTERLQTWLKVASLGAQISSLSSGSTPALRQKRAGAVRPATIPSLPTRDFPFSNVPEVPMSHYAKRNTESHFYNTDADFPVYPGWYKENVHQRNIPTPEYYTGTAWDYQTMQDFGPQESVPTNRRNPRKARVQKSAKAAAWRSKFGELSRLAQAHQVARGCSLKEAWDYVRAGRAAANPRGKRGKKRVTKSPALIAWRKQFAGLVRKAEFRAAAGEGLRTAWEKVYPKAQRHPAHHADIQAHIAANNPKRGIAGYVDFPRESEYEQVRGPYSFDPEFDTPPVNQRNPKGGPMIARFPGKCGLCGGDYDRGEEIAIVAGAEGPRGGKVRKHASC